MYKLLTHTVLRSYLILLVNLFMPLTLWGQQEPRYSIVGQCFLRWTTPPNFPEPATFDLSYDADLTLEAGGEVFETETDNRGRFSFPEIDSRLVHLVISVKGQSSVVYSGTIELMPGENIVLFQIWNKNNPNVSAITVEGDKWVFSIVPSPPRIPILYTEWTIEKLKSLPGAEYNRRKETITFSGNTLRRTKVDGVIGKGSVYVFGLNPEASE